MESWWLSSHWSGDRVVNDLQHTTLALTWSDGRSDRPDPISRLFMSSPSTYVLSQRSFKSALGANSQPLSVSCWKVMAEGQLSWENRNLTSAEDLKLATARKLTFSSSILVAYPCLNKGEWVSPLAHSHRSWTPWRVEERRASEKYTVSMVSLNKKKKRNLSESDSDNEAADFPRFIVIESLGEVYLT